jgi:hypothetical protein
VHRFAGTVGIVVTFALGACTSHDTQNLPPELGGCVPTGDAGCDHPGGGLGSGGTGEGGTGTALDAGTSADGAASCGQAGSLVTTSNNTCVPCITTSCCQADTACSAVPACLALLQCVQGCQSGDSVCFDNCENLQPIGISAYIDFANCMQSDCSPECPNLPTQPTGDF